MVDPVQQDPIPPQQSPVAPQPVNSSSSHANIIALLIFVFLLFILCGVGYFLLQTRHQIPQAVHTINTQSTPLQNSFATPTPEIVDTAPGLPIKDKAQILVHHSDSTFSTYLVPVTSISAYVHTLSQGDSVVKITNP